MGGEDYRSEALRHTHQNVCTLSVMASKRRSATSQMKPVKGYAAGGRKPSSKGKAPATKKEKLLGAELGKTGRAAERGKPVTNAQKGLGNYSRQTMQNKRMRDMPVKKKLEAFSDILIAGAVANPGSLMPSKIGIHHSVTPESGKPFTGKVLPSVKNKSLTAMDQKPGYSYLWDTGKGKSGITRAVKEADFQTKNIGDRILLEPGQKAVGYVTRVPRGVARQDVNVPGTIARQVPGSQKIVNTVVASGPQYRGAMTSFSEQNLAALSKAAQTAKKVEIAKSAAKIGAVTAPAVVANKKNKNKNNRR